MSLGKQSRRQIAVSRSTVYKRDGGACVVDGLFEAVKWPCSGGLTLQHRVGRGMGGSAKWDSPKALVAMCERHNFLQTADADFDAACRSNGWSIPRWLADRVDVSRVPVKYCDGWWLLDGGQRYALPESSALAAMQEFYE